jgi:serine/threonine protein kinase
MNCIVVISMGRATRDVFGPGDRIAGYEVERILGQGGFGDVYLVVKLVSRERFALKTEDLEAEKKGMANELLVLNKAVSPYLPRVYESETTSKYRYFVMDVMGPSLGHCVRQHRPKTLPLSVVMVIAHETLKIIREIHSLGVVHRDIKPSNFLVRPHSRYPLCLIDFGISKIHIENGIVVAPVNGRFVGTVRYASLNSFKRLDLGRGDDLMSWFYMICELANGKLPWKCKKGGDKMEIMRSKEDTPIAEVIGILPQDFVLIYELVSRLKYQDEPNYSQIHRHLESARLNKNISIQGDEWKWLWSLDCERSDLVSRTVGDEKYDSFEPSQIWKEKVEGGCCAVQ